MPEKKIQPEGILRKSEARIAAVKGLYAADITSNSGEKPEPLVIALDIISSYHSPNAEYTFAARPDEKFLTKIITGVCENREALDSMIKRNLGDTWTMDRLDQVMLALLRAAVFELSSIQNIPFKVIINEYLNISRSFFTDKESGFINGILDKIAHEVRE